MVWFVIVCFSELKQRGSLSSLGMTQKAQFIYKYDISNSHKVGHFYFPLTICGKSLTNVLKCCIVF